jgi:predicted transcriptional regulator
MIIYQLRNGPKTVSELEQLSGATQSAVSQFLHRMKLENFVTGERNRHFVTYKIVDLKVEKFILALTGIYYYAETDTNYYPKKYQNLLWR